MDERALGAGAGPSGVGPRPTRRAIEHPGRFAIVAIGLMIVASLLLFVGMESDTSTSTDPDALPSEIASVRPAPGTLAKPQQSVAVDLRGDLTGVLIIDGVEIPEDQLSRPSQSSMSFQPGPEKEFTRFSSGPHRVEVVFWPAVRTRDQSDSYSFSFRTTA